MAAETERSYADGLQFGIDLFTPVVEDLAVDLECELTMEASSRARQMYLRGQLRAFANVVGNLRLKLEQAIEGDTDSQKLSNARFMLSLECDEAIDRAEAIEEQIMFGYDPASRNNLAEHLEIAEREVDAALLKYALE